jgi:hypothetical protein
MKFANVKAMVAKSMILAVAAGALIIASPAKADAQRIVVGVYAANPYYAPRYDRYEFARHEEFARREALLRHEEWVRAHRFDHPYGYR